MAFIEWSDEYSFGLEDIDMEHKQLFALVNQLAESHEQGGEMRIATEVALEGLLSYTQTHFKNEESTFLQTDYPHKAKHVEMHRTLADRVAELTERFKSGDTDIVDDLLNFTRDWLQIHILKVDKEFVQFCKDKNIGVKSAFRPE